ncbi:MAG: hypothetical protein J7L45_00165 [Candidatus Aenigmarchaeota archaeon]|nr:hypothetical protein [Candidatus Aenigmarchaeota archaeon]
MRILTPFVYFFSKGRLLDVFIFKDEKFSSAPMGEFEGSRMSYGIITPILSVEKIYTEIITYEILSEPNDDK